MKCNIIIMIFIFYAISTFSIFGQGKIIKEDIEPMKKPCYFYSYTIDGKKEVCAICEINNNDTIIGRKITDNHYQFLINDTTKIEGELKRYWHLLNPFWNSCIVSDIVAYCPMGIWKYTRGNSVMYFQGHHKGENYLGPKYGKPNNDLGSRVFIENNY